MLDFISKTEKVSIVTFTVEMAEDIISKPSTNYRTIKQNIVKKYADDMKNGNWRFCGDSIRFDRDGNCIDGQHRLRAIIKSGCPQKFVVVEGLDAESAMVMDSGHKRSIEDYLNKQAEAYEKGATAIIKQVEILKRKDKNTGHSLGNIGLTNSDIVDLYAEDEDWYNKAARYGKSVSKDSSKVLKPTEVGSIYYYLTRVEGIDRSRVEDFFFKLCNTRRNDKSIYNTTMINLGKDNKDNLGRSGAKRIDEYIICWNAMLNGCKVQRKFYSNWFEKTPARRNDIEVEFASSAL